MENLENIGKIIKSKRLSMNMRMNDVASKAHITRATLGSIEKGNGGFSARSLFAVLDILGLSFEISNVHLNNNSRKRATRVNSCKNKIVNSFIIMCVERYALFKNISSKEAYMMMKEKELIKELTDDYEYFHVMSTEYINDYVDAVLRRNK